MEFFLKNKNKEFTNNVHNLSVNTTFEVPMYVAIMCNNSSLKAILVCWLMLYRGSIEILKCICQGIWSRNPKRNMGTENGNGKWE